MSKKVCKNCKQSFEAKRDFQDFCKTSCRVAYFRKHPKVDKEKAKKELLKTPTVTTANKVPPPKKVEAKLFQITSSKKIPPPELSRTEKMKWLTAHQYE